MGDSNEVCKNFLKGVCFREGNCRFTHPKNVEIKQACKDFLNDNCNRGEKCKFRHPPTCKDFENGHCPYDRGCRYYHPRSPLARGGPPPRDVPPFGRDGPPFGRSGRGFGQFNDDDIFNRRGESGPRKRPFDLGSGGPPSKMAAFSDVPESICRDHLRDNCFRTNCAYSHDWPPKGGSSNGFRGGFMDGPPPPSEMAAYIKQLEMKLTMYEDRVIELEKRCEQYEEFNKLLSERNDELKAKLEFQGGMRGPPGPSGGRHSGSFY